MQQLSAVHEAQLDHASSLGYCSLLHAIMLQEPCCQQPCCHTSAHIKPPGLLTASTSLRWMPMEVWKICHADVRRSNTQGAAACKVQVRQPELQRAPPHGWSAPCVCSQRPAALWGCRARRLPWPDLKRMSLGGSCWWSGCHAALSAPMQWNI